MKNKPEVYFEYVKNQGCSVLFDRKLVLFNSESALFQRKSVLKQYC